jgi:hypothetical protein
MVSQNLNEKKQKEINPAGSLFISISTRMTHGVTYNDCWLSGGQQILIMLSYYHWENICQLMK